jgi:hypothetical protein
MHPEVLQADVPAVCALKVILLHAEDQERLQEAPGLPRNAVSYSYILVEGILSNLHCPCTSVTGLPVREENTAFMQMQTS